MDESQGICFDINSCFLDTMFPHQPLISLPSSEGLLGRELAPGRIDELCARNNLSVVRACSLPGNIPLLHLAIFVR